MVTPARRLLGYLTRYRENDGTGVVYFAVNQHGYGVPLTVLDWDVTQIEGALLETWLPSVFQNLEAMARQYKARHGNLGVWIEDKSSGMVLIQQALRRNWPARGIDSKLTSVGKDDKRGDPDSRHREMR